MKDFKRGGSFGGGKKFGGDRGGSRGGSSFGGNRSRSSNSFEDRPMHKAVCDECGNTCEVPFRPTGDKPIFCNNCFSSKRDGDSKRDFGGDRGGNRGGKREFSKPAFNSAPKNDSASDKKIDDLKSQINAINVKLDSILSMIKTNAAKEDKTTLTSVVAKAVKDSGAKKVAKKAAPASTKKAPAKKKAVTKKK